MNSDGPILILTASAGAGHLMAAQAVREALRTRLPQSSIEVLDVLQATSAFFRALYAKGYLGLVRHAPSAMGMLYEATDRPNRHARDALRRGFQNLNARRTAEYLRSRRPRLIVNTHFLPAEIVGCLRRCGRLRCPQATVTTDFETHRLWVQPPTERYYTATAEGKAYLETWGVDPASVVVSGIPVRAAFNAPLDRAAFRRQQGLDCGRPLVLLLCGGFGVGPAETLLAELLAIGEDAQAAAIVGRNPALYRRLQAQAARSHRAVRVIGYTDQMHAWMQAADLVVTKPGGLTAAEALVCGLPTVIVSPIPGQESRNSDYLLEHGAAIKVNNLRLLRYRVGRLLAERPRLEALRAAALSIARPCAAKYIADDLLALLDRQAR